MNIAKQIFPEQTRTLYWWMLENSKIIRREPITKYSINQRYYVYRDEKNKVKRVDKDTLDNFVYDRYYSFTDDQEIVKEKIKEYYEKKIAITYKEHKKYLDMLADFNAKN